MENQNWRTRFEWISKFAMQNATQNQNKLGVIIFQNFTNNPSFRLKNKTSQNFRQKQTIIELFNMLSVN